MALRFSSWRAHWCRTHRQSCLLVVNATCPRHSRARVGFLGLLRLLLQLLALDHPQLLGQLLGQVLGQLVGFAAGEQAHGLAKGLGQRGRAAELARRLRAGARQPRHRVPRRQNAAAPRWRRRAAELHVGGVRAAGGRVVADVPGGQAGGPLRMGLPGGRGAAPKGALLLDLDVRGADPPLQRRWGMHTSVRRCGGAPLHAAAMGWWRLRRASSPSTCFVPGVPPRNKHSCAVPPAALCSFRAERTDGL